MVSNERTGTAKKKEQITIKKYANRRLYNTATSTYVTLDTLAEMVKDEIEFNVYDAKTGEDITRSVLIQIIVEAEANGKGNVLPTSFLRQLIGFYGGAMDTLVGKYLDQSMQTFIDNQDKVKDMVQTVTGGIFPVNNLEGISKQNFALFERTMKMFSPFGSEAAKNAESGAQAAVRRMRAESERSLGELQSQLDRLQSQISDIMRKRG